MKIMKAKEFDQYLEQMKQHVEKWRSEDQLDYESIRCRMIGWLGAEDRAFTGKQLEKIFDLCF